MSASPEPDLLDCLCFNVRLASREVSQLYDRHLAPLDLKVHQFAILAALGRSDGLAMQALAAGLGLDPSTLTRVLAPLVERGLVEVGPGVEDRRQRSARLSEAGREVEQAALECWERAQHDMAERLGGERFERLLGDLGAVHRALRAPERREP